MSGKPEPTGAKPQAPKLFKPGKFKVTMALEPKLEGPTAAQLTVIPSGIEANAEDKGPAPVSVYTSVAAKQGMFTSTSVKARAAPSGTSAVKEAPKKGAVDVSRPLALNFDKGEEGDEDFLAEEERALPPPPPMKRLVPVSVTQAPERPAALPAVAKAYLGLSTKPLAKSYTEDALKSRMTEAMAKTLVEVNTQLNVAAGKGMDLRKGLGVTSETTEGVTTYTLSQPFQEKDGLTEASLQSLDDLFKTMRIRLTTISGEGSLEEASTSQLAKDYVMMKKLVSFASKYKEEDTKRRKKEQREVLKDMMTPAMVDTLLALESKLSDLNEFGITFDSMEMTFPETESDPYVYSFEDGNTLLDVEDTPAAKQEGDAKLAAISSLFPGKTKMSLTKIIGNGAIDEEGSPLQKDIQFLTTLFEVAKELKEAKAAPVVVAKEEERASLEGTPYEALAGPIQAESSKAPYEITSESKYKPGSYPDKTGKAQIIPEQKGFIPQTRRAFGYFIYDKYRRYMLEALKELDPEACQKLGGSSNLAQIYEYQKFVRDYISFMTPYRGVLVYHGLGSGKTCTAIAASEALLSSGGKRRIIVMTPFSLRKNFIQQITFCGFRHYRLLNYWTSYEYRTSDGKNALWLFATSVLKIPESYLVPKKGKALRIWIPDLNKPQSEQNYTSLGAIEQSEIRNQIYETLVYDPKKKKYGLIWFLNYNGISAAQLRDIACREPDAFDNAVIVVDEIHNLIRLMQGTVDPYLKKMYESQVKSDVNQGDPKYLDPERITSEKWKPKNCGGNMNYKRGYLFYRLLLQATNTKIIGLSGTPLINFPEELGILANVLHGYNFLYTANLDKVTDKGGNEKILQGLKNLGEGTDPSNFCPYLDFYEITEVITSDRKVKIQFNFTLLPEGYQRIQNQLGVERIPFTEEIPTVTARLTHVRGCIDTILKSVNPKYIFAETFKERAEPLLPVMGDPSIPENKVLDDSFKGRFVDADGVSIKNAQVLMKRLSGLISYYKGSRKDLMPEVKPGDDVVVRVPMSLEQQRKYIAIRLGEIKIEKQKESAQRGAPEAAAGAQRDDAELKKLSSSQNYRMASRQACNFTFPDGFTRPRPLNAKEAKEADELGGNLEVLGGEEETSEESALVRSSQEETEESRREKEEAEKIAKEEEAISLEQERLELEQKREAMKGKSEGDIANALAEIQARYAMERSAGILVAEKAEEELSKELSPQQKRCLANKVDDSETYQMAINRSKECLLQYGLPKLRLEDPDRPGQSPLAKCSTKYKAMAENIATIPGSSLVYSQFLSMEGIGLFTIVLQANGYVPIKIVSRGGQYEFDEATEASLRKGPGAKENRLILFTGGEDEDVRKVNIDLFNAKFSELPSKIKGVLEESGFTEEIGNKRGELCRVFCITAAGAEGLSLKNVRGVHIMEPYWNDVRMAQVKGRAVRICSHQELPLADRNVKIYTYLSVFDRMAEEANPDSADNPWSIPLDIWTRDFLDRASAEKFGLTIASTKGEYAMTSDERLYFISERKKQLVENLIIVMKTAAADCLLNYNENRDGTFICRLLGNEGDFLYHPNLQLDIERSENEDTGDLFKVDEAEKKRIRDEDAKLAFEEKQEAAVEEANPKAEEEEEAVKPKAVSAAVPAAAAAPAAPVAAPVAPQPKKKQYVYPVVIAQKQYKVIGEEDGSGIVQKFLVYNDSSKKVGEAQAEKVKDKWIPKKGTVKFNKK
jgi:hypothetical protein